MLTHLRLDNRRVGLGVGLSYVLALYVNTHSLVDFRRKSVRLSTSGVDLL